MRKLFVPRTKPTRQQKEKTSPPPELSLFSLDAAISEASAATKESIASLSQQPRSLQSKINSTASLASATASFATAREHTAESVTTPVNAPYFADSSDDDDTAEGLSFDNDPLARISRASSSDATPTEISFNRNPEETTPTMSTVVETPALPAAKDPPVEAEDEAHFDVAQNVYGTIKGVWAWGKTVPVVSTFLGLTEAAASKFVETTISMDLPAIDQHGVTPQLKKLDGGVIDPVILAVWKIVEPALAKGDEMVVKPVMTEVVPRVLAPLGMFEKKEEEEKKEDEKEAMIDSSPTPEVVPAVN